MGLFGNKSNKVTAYFVFVGRLSGTSSSVEGQFRIDILNSLPFILRSQFGKNADASHVYSCFFSDWNKKGTYDRSLILDVKENGFNAYNSYGDRKRLLDELQKGMVYQFDVMLKDYEPSVCILSGSGIYAMNSGVYFICFEQKVKDGKLNRQIYP